jgi:DNA-binding PadR family transcriptional regulator
MADNEIRLNQQALFDVLDDLRRSGFIEGVVIKEGSVRVEEAKITLTEAGRQLIVEYARAFGCLGDYDKRHIEFLSEFLSVSAAKRIRYISGQRLIRTADGGYVLGI